MGTTALKIKIRKDNTMDLAKDVNNETVIKDMKELIEHHGYEKCHLLYDMMNYTWYPIWFETTKRENLPIRQLAIELLDLMNVGLESQSEMETQLIEHFGELLNN